MKRRVSSRDDLFLSAIDMYTLLSLVLIGFAFMSGRAGARERAIDLPIDEARVSREATGVLQVRWKADSKPLFQDTDLRRKCDILVAWPQDAALSASIVGKEASFRVPCFPRAFFEHALSPTLTELPELRRSMREEFPEAVILCDRGDPFACACLQWVMAYAGFRVRAMTAPPKSAP